MARPNPLLPVVVNISTMGVNMPTDYTRIFAIASYGDTGMTAGTYATITKTEQSEAKITADSSVAKFVKSYFANNNNGQLIVIEVSNTSDEEDTELQKAIERLEAFVNAKAPRCYVIGCPTQFYTEQKFIDLVNSYAGLTDGQYFAIELPLNTNPSSDETFAKYNKSKSFHPIIKSNQETESSIGAILGIEASAKYDLSASNPLSLLQWKTVYSVSPLEVSNSLLTAYNQNGCTWIGEFNKNIVVLGGMVGDGKNWEFYFALDTYLFKLISEIGTMMIQASNNPNIAIHFNQKGINTIGNKLKAISDNMINFGVLEEFGSDYNTETHEILNTGQFNMIDYPTFKNQSYEKWTNGIYDGASVFATIGNFVLQIKPNITIE